MVTLDRAHSREGEVACRRKCSSFMLAPSRASNFIYIWVHPRGLSISDVFESWNDDILKCCCCRRHHPSLNHLYLESYVILLQEVVMLANLLTANFQAFEASFLVLCCWTKYMISLMYMCMLCSCTWQDFHLIHNL